MLLLYWDVFYKHILELIDTNKKSDGRKQNEQKKLKSQQKNKFHYRRQETL